MSEDVMVAEDGTIIEEQPGTPTATTQTEAGEQDKGQAEEQHIVADGDEDAEHDEEGHAAETPEEAEARRERNRARRLQSKQRRRERIDSLERELASRDRVINEMNQRLATVERKSSGSEMAQLDSAEREAVSAYNRFKEINAKAIEQANGEIANEAQERMFQARQRIEQLQNIRKAMTKRQAAPTPLDPRLLSHAQAWMNENKWYDPNGTDEDSAIVITLDNRLAQEGWNPTTPEYWKELRARVNRILPHRANSGYNRSTNVERQTTAPPVTGSGRESSVSNTKGAYRLSQERVTALKEAGVWDDPKLRADAIKRFQQFDKEQQA